MEDRSNEARPTLLLVDGSSYLYRAFHALPDLRNAAFEPTGAIYGVLNMLRRLRLDVPADYSACVFDAKGKTFRDDLYPEYKTHRPPMPEALAAQIAPLKEAIAALGWPLLEVSGVEADDVIGTLAREASARGMDCIVSTGDKDMAQLVDGHITLVNTMSSETLDPAGVAAKFGVPPERIVDYLALIGDSVDNVPGVPKVGPKTAVKWLEKYGDLDGVMTHAAEIAGVVGENLRGALSWLPTARELVTIRTDVALPVAFDALRWGAVERETLSRLFRRFEFRTWLREMDSVPGDDPTPAPVAPRIERCYETLLDWPRFDAWLEKLRAADIACLDTETTGLDPMRARLVGMSFSVATGEAAYLPLMHAHPGTPEQLPIDTVLARLKPWLEDAARPKVGQNLKYDAHVFLNHGIRLDGIAHDTLLQSYVLEAHKPHDMDSLAARHLNEKTIKYEEVCGKGVGQIGFDQVDIQTATQYAAEDADITLRLHETLLPRVRAEAGLARVYRDIEMPLLPVLLAVERNGMLIDRALLAAQSVELAEHMRELESRAHEAAEGPFNIGSPKQIQEILFTRKGLPVLKKTPGGAPSTDEDVLTQLAADHPLPRLILDWRMLAKLKSTYVDKLPEMIHPTTGRVHTSFSQATAVTGRLSSSDPNLQNIPARTPEGRRIREAFIAPPGWKLISADYSQIELRIMAHLSNDPGLLDAFARDADVHSATAAEIFGVDAGSVNAEQRRIAKVINFGLIYGMSAFGLASQLNLERAAAQNYIDRYFARYPGVAAYMDSTRKLAKQHGFVETVFGRRLCLPDIHASNPNRRQGAERAAINAPMQGTAADLIKLSMIAVQGWLAREKLQSRLILQVHDELVLECPEDEAGRVGAALAELMSGVAKLAVPLKVGIGMGTNWEAAH